jgi:tRNA pseudouridine38-40 synthase
MPKTIYLLIAYDGTDFHGWQHQPGLRTVQAVLAESIQRVVRHEVDLIGSGRTDAGVHAAGQVASFVTTCELPVNRLRYAIGSRLPEDVAILASREVHPDFHATRSAASKLYRYRIHHSKTRPVPHRTQRYTYHCWKDLDLGRMRLAAGHFIGEMDFSAMAGKGSVRLTTVRRVLRCDVERHLDEVRIDVEGKGFLYNQVRNMVGTLVNVGLGQWEPDDVPAILEGRDRAKAGPTMPARGLCLQWVRYPSHLLTEPQAFPARRDANPQNTGTSRRLKPAAQDQTS